MVTTRQASPADVPTLHTLACRIWRAYYPAIIPREQVEYMLGWMYAPDVIRRELSAGVVWELILLGEQPVGYASYVHEPEAGKLKLNKLYLAPELHGRGLGRQVLERIKARGAELNAREVYLTVNRGNTRAIRAYTGAGFRIAGTVVNDIGGGFVMDDYVMACALHPAPGV